MTGEYTGKEVRGKTEGAVFCIIIAIVSLLLLSWNIFICKSYPYYYAWDMDQVTVLDTMLIHSGLRPDHINHTGFGMYLFLFFSEQLAHCSGFLSVLDLDDVVSSLNPLAGIAELTEFVRLHSPFLVMSIVVLLVLSVQSVFKVSKWCFLLFFLVLGTGESLTYQSSVIRSETYSIFFWSGAVLAVIIAAKQSIVWFRYVLSLAGGLLLGLCFVTKIQAFFYVVAFVPLLLLLFSFLRDNRKQVTGNTRSLGVYFAMVAGLINVILYACFWWQSYSVALPEVPLWAEGFGITTVGVFFFVVLLILLLGQLYLCIRRKTGGEVFGTLSVFTFVAAGFVLSFLLHFLLYSDAGTSLNYALIDFKMIFLRKPVHFRFEGAAFYISNLLAYFRFNPTVIIVNIMFGFLLVLGHFQNWVRISKKQLTLCLLLMVIALGVIIFGTRSILRDLIWKEMLLDLLSISFFAVLVSNAIRHRAVFTILGSCLLGLLVLVNCSHSLCMPDRMDANYNLYGWSEDKLFDLYDGWSEDKLSEIDWGGLNGLEYRKIMRRKYDDKTTDIARSRALEHRSIRRTVDFVFKNQAITHRNIGIAYRGYPAWTSDLSYKIVQVPAVISGDILVDNTSIKNMEGVFFKKEYVREHSEYFDKFVEGPSEKKISVLTRRDLKIFIFVQAEDVPKIVSKEIVKTNYKLTVYNTIDSIKLFGLEVTNYSEIVREKLSDKFFFVVHKL